MATLCRVFGRRVVIYRAVAVGFPHRLGVVPLDFLCRQPDPHAGIAAIPKFDDVLAVEGLTDLLDVFLQPFVGEKRRGLRRSGRRPGQRSGPLRDIRKELCLLIRMALLLKELVVERRQPGLLRLLLLAARRQLRVRPSQRRRLRARADLRDLRASAQLPGKVRLPRRQVHTLLLLRGGQRCAEPGVQQLCVRLRIGQVLLVGEITRRDPSPIAPKRSRFDRLALKAAALLGVLLFLAGQLAGEHAVHKGREILPDLATCDSVRVGGPRARLRQLRAAREERLRHPGGVVRVRDSGLLSARQRGHERVRVAAVRLERRARRLFGPSVDRVISRQNLLRHLNLRGRRTGFTAAHVYAAFSAAAARHPPVCAP